jgi:hypothetical protein
MGLALMRSGPWIHYWGPQVLQVLSILENVLQKWTKLATRWRAAVTVFSKLHVPNFTSRLLVGGTIHYLEGLANCFPMSPRLLLLRRRHRKMHLMQPQPSLRLRLRLRQPSLRLRQPSLRLRPRQPSLRLRPRPLRRHSLRCQWRRRCPHCH